MKKHLRIFAMALFSVFAIAGMRAQDAAYLVGNLSGWKEPSEQNADYYVQYQLEPTGDYVEGYPILRGKFKVDLKGEDPMFRFYTALSGWDGGASIGSQEIDDPMDFTMQMMEASTALTPGKGSFRITDWEGEYMYVTLCNMRLTVSPDGYLDIPEIPKFYYSNGQPEYMKDCYGSPNVYSLKLDRYSYQYSQNGKYVYEGQISVPGKMVGMPNEKEVYVKADELLVDDYGIAIKDVEFVTAPCNLTFNGDHNSRFSDHQVYLDVTNKKLYFNWGISRWVRGDFNSVPAITFDNYKNYDEYLLTTHNNPPNSIIIEAPETELKFDICAPTFDKRPPVNYYWRGTDYNWYINNNDDNSSYTCWLPQPGNIILSFEYIGYIESFDKMYARLYNDNNAYDKPVYTPFVKSASNPDILEAELDIPASGMTNYLELKFNDKNYNSPSLYLKETPVFNGDGDPVSLDYAYSVDGYNIGLLQFGKGGKLKIAVNRSNHTVQFIPEAGAVEAIPLAYIDGNQQYFMNRVADNVFADSYGAGRDNTYKLSNGKNIVIDLENPVSEEDGVTTYNYTATSDKDATALTKPEESLWLPGSNYGYNLLNKINIDTENQLVKILRPYTNLKKCSDSKSVPDFLYLDLQGHIANTYLYKTLWDFKEDYKGLDQFLHSPRLALVKEDTESDVYVYEGKFTMPENAGDYIGENDAIMLRIGFFPINYENMPELGVGPMNYYSYYDPDTEDNHTYNAIFAYYPGQIYFNNVSGDPNYAVRVTLEKNAVATIWIGNGAAGVEDVEGVADVFKVASAQGVVRIESSRDCHVDFYTIAGQHVRSLDIAAGITYVNGLASGIYIVNGQKVVVR